MFAKLVLGVNFHATDEPLLMGLCSGLHCPSSIGPWISSEDELCGSVSILLDEDVAELEEALVELEVALAELDDDFAELEDFAELDEDFFELDDLAELDDLVELDDLTELDEDFFELETGVSESPVSLGMMALPSSPQAKIASGRASRIQPMKGCLINNSWTRFMGLKLPANLTISSNIQPYGHRILVHCMFNRNLQRCRIISLRAHIFSSNRYGLICTIAP